MLLAEVPGSQLVQPDDPGLAACAPARQSVHDDAALPLHLPAPQSLHCSDEFVLREPALQAVHVEEPLATPVWKPASHTRHSPSRGTGAYLPLSQGWHMALAEYSPLKQLWQPFWSALGAAPGPQVEQSPPKASL